MRLTGLLGVRSLEELRALARPNWLLRTSRPSGRSAWPSCPCPWAAVTDTSWPIVDGHVLPRSPYEVFSAGEQARVPLLTGNAAGEAAAMPGLADVAAHRADAEREYCDLAGRFLSLYPAETDEEASAASVTANSDRIFTWQNRTWARLHARTGAATWLYRWEHEPPVPAGYAEGSPGAFHACEIPYTFGTLDARDWDWRPVDRELSATLSGYWTAFAATGDPNGTDLNGGDPNGGDPNGGEPNGGEPNGGGRPFWEPFDPDHPAVLRFAARITQGPPPDAARIAVLSEHYARLRDR